MFLNHSPSDWYRINIVNKRTNKQIQIYWSTEHDVTNEWKKISRNNNNKHPLSPYKWELSRTIKSRASVEQIAQTENCKKKSISKSFFVVDAIEQRVWKIQQQFSCFPLVDDYSVANGFFHLLLPLLLLFSRPFHQIFN